jgi:hypothetical protein
MNYSGQHEFKFLFAINDTVKIKFSGAKAQIVKMSVLAEELSYLCRLYGDNGTMYEYNYNACEIELWEEKKAGI